MKCMMKAGFIILILQTLIGCTVITATVGVTTAVVGGAIEVVDTVTPDIFDDDEEEEVQPEQ